ncbi:MAG TPA: hypothetical protein VHZ50_18930 [Puia sp.]|nr:hypothetical protein [Puia sp.]
MTPLVLFIWFLHSRWTIQKLEYYKDIPGSYGGFVTDTVNTPEKFKRYDGGVTMEILEIDSNGYFRGEFQYTENEILMDKPAATERKVLASINFFTGKISYRWNLKFWRFRNPMLWKTNRIHNGNMYVVSRLDIQTENVKDILQRVYYIIHYRESKLFEFNQKEILVENSRLPNILGSLKS